MSKTDKSINVVKSGLNKLQSLGKTARGELRKKPLRRWLMLVGIGVAVTVALTAGVLYAHRSPRFDLKAIDQLEAKIGAAPTMAELQAKAIKEPKNAGAQLDLAHARFDANQRTASLGSYDLALKLDPKLASERVVKNLVACAGTKDQNAAFNLITKYKLTGAEGDLHNLSGDHRYVVRTGAVATLDRMGQAAHRDWERLWLTDLGEKSCDVRRNAVDKLGTFGDKASIAAIKAAKKKDDAETRWWQFSCLGGKAGDAETKIANR